MASTSFRKIWNRSQKLKKDGMEEGKYAILFKGSTDHFVENGAVVLQESISLFRGRTNPIRYFSVDEVNTMNLEQHVISFKESDVKWYKGFWDGRFVLVKEQSEKCHPSLTLGTFREIVVAAQMSTHKNVPKLLGCCLETKYTVLVFEWVENVNLHDLVFRKEIGKPPLEWTERLRIAWEIAHALAYLHTGFHRPIIHRSLKPRNVYLGRDYAAKLSDFSLCISVPEGKKYFHEDLIVGTYGYLAPESSSGKVAESVDVYAFGMLLLVLLTGKEVVFKDGGVETHLRDWFRNSSRDKCTIEVLDSAIAGDRLADNEELEKKLGGAIQLALGCTEMEEESRPTMVEVATQLKGMVS